MYMGGSGARRAQGGARIPVLGVHGVQILHFDRGHSPLPCISSAAALNKNWNFPAHLLPAEMVTASLSREREKGDKTFATI